jgi:hypothetical protein
MKRLIFLSAIAACSLAWAAQDDPPVPANHDQVIALPKATAGGERVRTGQFFFPRLQFQCKENVPDKWDVHPIGDQVVRNAIKSLTNINILTDPVVVNLDQQEEMCKYPYVFMTSEGDFTLTDKNIATLREYILRGGFLYADDCVLNQDSKHGDHFYRSFISEMARAFPDNPMRPVPNDHEIYKCFFQLDGPPHLQGVKHPAYGLFEKNTNRLMAMVTSGDIHCGWVRFGNLDKNQCTLAIQLGCNVVMYCLTH